MFILSFFLFNINSISIVVERLSANIEKKGEAFFCIQMLLSYLLSMTGVNEIL